MAVVTTKISLDVNSDPLFGAENLNATNSRFEINLEQPIFIPNDAINATVSVEEATVWNTVNNISVALNNNTFAITDGLTLLSPVIPNGSYSTSSLSQALNREYVALGGTSGLVSLEEDFPTQRVILVLDGTISDIPNGGVSVDFTGANTPRDVLGFDSQIVGPVIVLLEQLGDNEAAFNNIEYFKIHWDGGQGIRSNNAFDQTMTRVNITVPAGSQIVSEPQNPATSEAESWIGNRRNHLVFWLTDQANVEVDTGEIWSARMVFQYEEIIFPPANPDIPSVPEDRLLNLRPLKRRAF